MLGEVADVSHLQACGIAELPAALSALESAEYVDAEEDAARWVARAFTATPTELVRADAGEPELGVTDLIAFSCVMDWRANVTKPEETPPAHRLESLAGGAPLPASEGAATVTVGQQYPLPPGTGEPCGSPSPEKTHDIVDHYGIRPVHWYDVVREVIGNTGMTTRALAVLAVVTGLLIVVLLVVPVTINLGPIQL